MWVAGGQDVGGAWGIGVELLGVRRYRKRAGRRSGALGRVLNLESI